MYALEGLKRDVPFRGTDVLGRNGWWAHPLLWLGLALVSMAPFLLSPLPPMADLLSHIGRYHVMVFGNQSEFLPRYYSFQWTLIGNLGQDLLAYPLTYLIGAERAGFFLSALIPPATILGIRRLSIAAHGAVQPGALLAVPFAYAFPFLFGFVNYSMGIALSLWVAAAWFQLRDRRGLATMGLFILLGTLVWVVHMAAWAVLVVAVGSIELIEALKARGWQPLRVTGTAVLRVLPLVVVPILLTLLWRNGVSGAAEDSASPLPVLWLKFHWIAFILRDQRLVLDVGSVVLIGIVGLLLLLRRNRVNPGLALTAALLTVMFFVMPAALFNSFFADLRLLPPLAIFGLIALGANRLSRREKSMVAAFAAALFLVRISETTAGWVNRGAALSADLQALDHVERGARIAALAPNRMFEAWENTGLSHIASLAIVRRDAFVNTEWNNAGAQLMRPIYNAGQDFNSADSAKLLMRNKGEGRTIENMVAHLPRQRFDYIWLFKADLPDNLKQGFELKFRNSESALYAVRHDLPAGG